MAETKIQTAKRRALERRALTGAGAREVASEQEAAMNMRQGYRSMPMPPSKPRPTYRGEQPMYAPGPPATAGAMGGAKDDPNVEITVGPDGKVVRRRKES